MLSLTSNPLLKSSIFSPLSRTTTNGRRIFHPKKPLLGLVSATLIPSSNKNPSPSPAQQNLYQPFRPPPSPLPTQFRSLDTSGRINVLASRLGLWFEYATLIPTLYNEGFTPPTIEELTGISGVEQNRLIVGAQVRDSLVQSKAEPEVLAAFDTGGAELLYEIRLLSATQRAAAAKYIVDHSFDGKKSQDLAKAIKDYPRRKGEKGWKEFDYMLPGDCLSFMYYRQSREHRNPSEARKTMLEMALEVAETEKARKAVIRELKGESDGKGGKEEETVAAFTVPVVRLKYGEVAEATTVVVLPVCRAEEGGSAVLEAPLECKQEGEFGVLVAEKGWERWVVLPGWEPVMAVGKGGVAVAFRDDRKALPWKAKEEAMLVVADRGRREVEADEGFYLVERENNGDGGLKLEKGSALKEKEVEKILGAVVMVVRPPRDEDDDQLSDEDWD